MKTFIQYLKEQEEKRFSCLMAAVDDGVKQDLLYFGASIPNEDLTEDGREDFPHVTVLYGLHTNNPRVIRELIESNDIFRPFTIRLGKMSLFQSQTADVLKVEVTAHELVEMNSVLRTLPYTNEFKDYIPHLTIAYLKPGQGHKYAGNTRFDGRLTRVNRLVFSDQNKEQSQINLV